MKNLGAPTENVVPLENHFPWHASIVGPKLTISKLAQCGVNLYSKNLLSIRLERFELKI